MEGFRLVWRSRYLTLIAALVVVLNLINTNGEYILATFVIEHAHSSSAASQESAEDYITLFYSKYLFATTSISFLIQLLLVSYTFNRIGIEGALLVLPVLMLANYSLMVFLPIMVVVRSTLALENSVYYSLQTTTRHALFLPVKRDEKYVGKHTIDTFFVRVGDVLSGGFVYIAGTLIGLGIVGFMIVNIVLAAMLLYLSLALGRQHRDTANQYLSNKPPVLATPLHDACIKAGVQSRLQLNPDAFVDTDVGDALSYRAYTFYSRRLPPWIAFDSLQRCLVCTPPIAESGSLRIRVVARDFDGLEAESSFTLTWGD